MQRGPRAALHGPHKGRLRPLTRAPKQSIHIYVCTRNDCDSLQKTSLPSESIIFEFLMQSSPKAPKPLVASSALHAGSAVAARQEHASATPAASGMIGIGAIILKTPLGLRVIKLRPTGGAFASGKVGKPAAKIVANVTYDLPGSRRRHNS